MYSCTHVLMYCIYMWFKFPTAKIIIIIIIIGYFTKSFVVHIFILTLVHQARAVNGVLGTDPGALPAARSDILNATASEDLRDCGLWEVWGIPWWTCWIPPEKQVKISNLPTKNHRAWNWVQVIQVDNFLDFQIFSESTVWLWPGTSMWGGSFQNGDENLW